MFMIVYKIWCTPAVSHNVKMLHIMTDSLEQSPP
jgi:hypothetical protein